MQEFRPIDCVEALQERMRIMRAAQREFSKFTQEQVDHIFFEAAMAANKARIPLAKMAVEETGMGVMEDKVIKNHYASEYIYHAYRNTKTVGVIEQDDAFGIKKIAEPIGLVAAVIPTTNPTSTAIFKALLCLKTRNAILISPHPRAKKCTAEAARIVYEAAVKAGAPEGIIGCIEYPSLELTGELMHEADIILATGGPGMVHAAYSSGKPALGVGAGNTPVIIDETADIKLAVSSIIHSKTFDNGMICASEQSVTVLDSIYDEVRDEFERRGCAAGHCQCHRRVNGAGHIVRFSRTVELRNDDRRAGRKSDKEADQQVDERAGRSADRCQGFLADELADNDGVRRVIKLLKERAQHNREKEQQQLFPNHTVGNSVRRKMSVFTHMFLIHTSSLRTGGSLNLLT